MEKKRSKTLNICMNHSTTENKIDRKGLYDIFFSCCVCVKQMIVAESPETHQNLLKAQNSE